MLASKDFEKIFYRLKKNFTKYEIKLTPVSDDQENYILEGPYSERFKKNLWFGGVQVKKNYVSYHLMPVYMYKELAESIPANLKKRMQGKSCFNFKSYDENLFKELESFTDKCYNMFIIRADNIQ